MTKVFNTLSKFIPILFAAIAIVGLFQRGFDIDLYGAPAWLYEHYEFIRSKLFSLLHVLFSYLNFNFKFFAFEQDCIVVYFLLGASVLRCHKYIDSELAKKLRKLSNDIDTGEFSFGPWTCSWKDHFPHTPSILDILRETWSDTISSLNTKLNTFDLILLLTWPATLLFTSRHTAAINHRIVPSYFPGFYRDKWFVFFGIIIIYVLSAFVFIIWSYLSSGALEVQPV